MKPLPKASLSSVSTACDRVRAPVAGSDPNLASEPLRVDLRAKLQRALSSVLGVAVFVTDSACPAGGNAAAAGANCFWVECFADEHAGELRRVAGGMPPSGRGPAELLSLGVSVRESEG
jgi:hypothetical protein